MKHFGTSLLCALATFSLSAQSIRLSASTNKLNRIDVGTDAGVMTRQAAQEQRPGQMLMSHLDLTPVQRDPQFPSLLRVKVSHAAQTQQRPKIALAPYTETLYNQLVQLHNRFVDQRNRLLEDTSDVEVEGVPRVRSPFSGRWSDPTIHVSKRDVQNANERAERAALLSLDNFYTKLFHIHWQAVTDGSTYHFNMPPGEYVLCAMQKLRPPRDRSLSLQPTAIWWTLLTVDGTQSYSLTLDEHNAVPWMGVFQIE